MIVRSILAKSLVLGVTGRSAAGSCAPAVPAEIISAPSKCDSFIRVPSRQSDPGNAHAELNARCPAKNPLHPDVDIEAPESQLLQAKAEAEQVAALGLSAARRAVQLPYYAGSHERDKVQPLEHRDGERNAQVDRAGILTEIYVRSVPEPELRSERTRRAIIPEETGDRGASGDEIEAGPRTIHGVATVTGCLTVLPPLVAAGDAEDGSTAHLIIDSASDSEQILGTALAALAHLETHAPIVVIPACRHR